MPFAGRQSLNITPFVYTHVVVGKPVPTFPRHALEEAKLLRAVAHQHVLGILVVIEHLQMVLAPDP
ncbi:hypothetical protein B998_00503 [Brucella sp. F96/2]|nr:hypothetical protein C983_00167 [Brucella sp. F23/97]ENT18211.1 hypothetical protein B998_00503 [Brucella sp. F96/2]ENT24431.1 hypothetical protein C065_00165 [Brucella sp. UK1/97]